MTVRIEFQEWIESAQRPEDASLTSEALEVDSGLVPNVGDVVEFTGEYGRGVYRVRSRYFGYEPTSSFINIVVDEIDGAELGKYLNA